MFSNKTNSQTYWFLGPIDNTGPSSYTNTINNNLGFTTISNAIPSRLTNITEFFGVNNANFFAGYWLYRSYELSGDIKEITKVSIHCHNRDNNNPITGTRQISVLLYETNADQINSVTTSTDYCRPPSPSQISSS
jgi:hypothetical protein